MRSPKPLTYFTCCAAFLLVARKSQALPPWVERPLTLPSGDWAFDFGLGVGHVPAPGDDTAAGVNAEMAVGITRRIELGLRTGLRFGNAFDRGVNADGYGRLFDRQTFDGGGEVLANPELRVRGALLREPVVELALEGRLVVPFADGTAAGMMFGVPMAFHLYAGTPPVITSIRDTHSPRDGRAATSASYHGSVPARDRCRWANTAMSGELSPRLLFEIRVVGRRRERAVGESKLSVLPIAVENLIRPFLHEVHPSPVVRIFGDEARFRMSIFEQVGDLRGVLDLLAVVVEHRQFPGPRDRREPTGFVPADFARGERDPFEAQNPFDFDPERRRGEAATPTRDGKGRPNL